jgi:hypothetical protein
LGKRSREGKCHKPVKFGESRAFAQHASALSRGISIELEAGDTRMLYKKINVELIVVADEAEAVVEELNLTLNQLEERHTIFGGEIEAVAFEHTGTRKRSALAHTLAAGGTVAAALKTARESVAVAYRAVI